MRASFVLPAVFVFSVYSQNAVNPPGSAAIQGTVEPETRKLGSLSGTIVNASTGEPVRKATLTIYALSSRAATGAARQSEPLAVRSDAEGKFLFDKLEPGRYSLSAEKAGFTRQQYGSRTDGPGTLLSVQSGQKITGLQFQFVPQAVLSGRVVDEDGEPVMNAMVQALRRGSMSSKPVSMMGASTDDRGQFRIANLAPGKYLLEGQFRAQMGMARPAAAKPEGRMDYVRTFYPGSLDPQSAVPFVLKAGQEVAGIEFRLQQTKVYSISGRVEGVSLSPGSRVSISLQPRMRTPRYMFSGGGALLRPDGTFMVDSAVPGDYNLVAMNFENGRPLLIARVPVTVGNRDVENVVIQAGSPLALTGSVRAENPAAEKPTGQVALQQFDGMNFASMPAPIKPDGTFQIDGVSRDKHRVAVIQLPDGYYVKSVRAGNTDVMETGLDLTSAQSAPALEIVVSNKGANVEGSVYDGEKPVPGAAVVLLPYPYREDVPFQRKGASTDQNGSFAITGIPPGEYRVYGLSEGLPYVDADPEVLKQLEPFAVPLKLKEEGREQVKLKLAAIPDR